MFARKKPSDVQTSLQRFCDLHRDPASRAKHFRLAFESLVTHDKRQLIEDFSFEAFHLIDSLLYHVDPCVDSQLVFDAESALWTLEQVLCYGPELVGKGWQKNAIETILKRALLPRNLLTVRKIGIRLFLIWYQILSIYNNANHLLDVVFQCCLPYFPLREGQQSEKILQTYCENFDNPSTLHGYAGFEPIPVRITPIILDTVVSSNNTTTIHFENVGVRERAQTLQIYLDKFLEYCCRETLKIEWAEDARRIDSAKFIIDRVIMLYIHEVFPDIEANGVDLFGGWEGSEEPAQLLDTADPIVIARYWLIRWITNIASAAISEHSSKALLLYRQVLYSNQKAINILLTLMREAMQLPLACHNVIHKVLYLLGSWILQKEIPPFLEPGNITIEAWNLLLIHMLTSFFKSPYLISSGERLPSAISLTGSILQIIRDLSNPSISVLPRQLPRAVWTELIKRLSRAVLHCCARADAFGSATAGGFTRTLLNVCVFVRVIREVDMEEAMWDDVWLVFKEGIWNQMIEQWSKVVENMTRALILNLFAIDMLQLDVENNNTVHSSSLELAPHFTSRHQKLAKASINASLDPKFCGNSDNGSLGDSGGGGVYLMGAESEDDTHGNGIDGFNRRRSNLSAECYEKANSEKDAQGVVQSTGNISCWLRAWMRIIHLVDPSDPRHTQLAVQTFSRAIELLLRVGCANVLVHWLAQLILRLPVVNQPHAIAPLCAVLVKSQPPSLASAYILYHLLECLRADEAVPLVLEQLPQMSLEELGVVSVETINTLQKLVKNSEFSKRAVKVAALLALNHSEAEKILLSLLEKPTVEIDLSSFILCVNALSILILERADDQLFHRLIVLLNNHPEAGNLFPIFCSNLSFVTRLGLHKGLAEALFYGLSNASPNASNDLKWELCALLLSEKSREISWKPLIDRLHSGQDYFLEGVLVQLAKQYPLPGFSITQWNSLSTPSEMSLQKTEIGSCGNENSCVFINTHGALLSFDSSEKNSFLWSRNVVGRHCYSAEILEAEDELESPINVWLKSLGASSFTDSLNHKESSEIFGTISDPFQEIPRSKTHSTSHNTPPAKSHSGNDSSLGVADMMNFIRSSKRTPEKLLPKKFSKEDRIPVMDGAQKRTIAWRQFVADLQLVEKVGNVPTNFHREIRHLDTTLSREVHKVAIIFVGKDQEDKQTILSNTTGSSAFNQFVDKLGWPVQIGSPNFQGGYTGGLPVGQTAPYFATLNTELIFHVSTLLQGDATQKLKHLGNDEVHVVWTEHTKSYRRELIATRFCDVLIVLYPIYPVLVRVHIETQDQSLQFGPLFDGACVHINQVASLTRETVLNASCAYRNARLDSIHVAEGGNGDIPSSGTIPARNKHRERVFQQTKQHLGHLCKADSIVRLYAPILNS